MDIMKCKEVSPMKVARFVLKVVALALVTAAAVCTVIAFWDKIIECVGTVSNKVRSRYRYAEGCCIDDEDDYTDWDE